LTFFQLAFTTRTKVEFILDFDKFGNVMKYHFYVLNYTTTWVPFPSKLYSKS
jgi:hypothetical protein